MGSLLDVFDFAKYSPEPADLDWLLAFPKFGCGKGLGRMSLVLEAIQDEGLELIPAIKVTGSNGKGSVVALASAILQALGLKTGHFISPHLFSFNERINVDGMPLSRAELSNAIQWFRGVLARLPAETRAGFGGFEVFTALGLYHFARARVAAIVLEAGIGGRYDATRPSPGSLVGLSSLDLEHTQLLGHNLLEIACDKMDLCPTGGTLVLSQLGKEAPLDEIRRAAHQRGFSLIETAQATWIEDLVQTPGQSRFRLSVGPLEVENTVLNLAGAHQIENARLAVLLTLQYLRQQNITFEQDTLIQGLRTGLNQAHWPGRAQKVWADPTVIVDVGHTPQAIQAFLDTLPGLIGAVPVLLVTGVSENKEVEQILRLLLPHAAKVLCTRAHKGLEAAQLQAVIQQLAPDCPCTVAPDIKTAVAQAVACASAEGMAVVVAGGLFLAAEFMAALASNTQGPLRFF